MQTRRANQIARLLNEPIADYDERTEETSVDAYYELQAAAIQARALAAYLVEHLADRSAAALIASKIKSSV